MHADAQQIANLLFTKGKGGKPALNEAAKKANIDIGSIDGKQIGISGHSLGGAPAPPNTVPLDRHLSICCLAHPAVHKFESSLLPSAVGTHLCRTTNHFS